MFQLNYLTKERFLHQRVLCVQPWHHMNISTKANANRATTCWACWDATQINAWRSPKLSEFGPRSRWRPFSMRGSSSAARNGHPSQPSLISNIPEVCTSVCQPRTLMWTSWWSWTDGKMVSWLRGLNQVRGNRTHVTRSKLSSSGAKSRGGGGGGGEQRERLPSISHESGPVPLAPFPRCSAALPGSLEQAKSVSSW